VKIGIVGKGFVGSAVQNGFSPNTGCDAEVRVYDKNPSRSLHSLEETVNESDVVFISTLATFWDITSIRLIGSSCWANGSAACISRIFIKGSVRWPAFAIFWLAMCRGKNRWRRCAALVTTPRSWRK